MHIQIGLDHVQLTKVNWNFFKQKKIRHKKTPIRIPKILELDPEIIILGIRKKIVM